MRTFLSQNEFEDHIYIYIYFFIFWDGILNNLKGWNISQMSGMLKGQHSKPQRLLLSLTKFSVYHIIFTILILSLSLEIRCFLTSVSSFVMIDILNYRHWTWHRRFLPMLTNSLWNYLHQPRYLGPFSPWNP